MKQSNVMLKHSTQFRDITQSFSLAAYRASNTCHA